MKDLKRRFINISYGTKLLSKCPFYQKAKESDYYFSFSISNYFYTNLGRIGIFDPCIYE